MGMRGGGKLAKAVDVFCTEQLRRGVGGGGLRARHGGTRRGGAAGTGGGCTVHGAGEERRGCGVWKDLGGGGA